MFIRGETGWYAARHCSRVPLALHCSENKPLQPASAYFSCEILVGALNGYLRYNALKCTSSVVICSLRTRQGLKTIRRRLESCEAMQGCGLVYLDRNQVGASLLRNRLT